MTHHIEGGAPVVVVGAGPAGTAAARAAAELAPVVLLDEAPEARRDADLPDRVDLIAGTAVWGLFPGLTIAAVRASRMLSLDASAVVVATGARDRSWPVCGWEQDTVYRPGELLDAIDRAVVDPDARIGAIGLPDDLARLARSLRQHGSTLAASVPLTPEVRIEAVAPGTRRIVTAGASSEVDVVVTALGLLPDARLALQVRPDRGFHRGLLAELPLLDAAGRTSVPGVLVTGAAAGQFDPEVARAHGARAGRAAGAFAAGEPWAATGRTLPDATGLAPPLPDDDAPVADRAEGVTMGALRAAIRDGAWDVNDLRRRTRAGMGPHGEALPVLAALLLEQDPDIAEARLIARVRPPLRPVPFAAVLGAGRERPV